MGIRSFLFGPREEEYQPTLTGHELTAIQAHEDWRANGGNIDSEDWLEMQSRYSGLVERGVVLEQTGENGDWRWNKEDPSIRYQDDPEPEPRKKFLGFF